MKPEVLMKARKMWPLVQRRHKVYKSEWAESNRLSISLFVLFSETPNFLAKAVPRNRKCRERN